ncbi:hypothetical protein Taro_033559, partial [Colocasia esculenta]|nr:hypothetical protein [Colocasia esculenta]
GTIPLRTLQHPTLLVFLHTRREQHPGYHTRSSFTTEGNNNQDTTPGLPSQPKGTTPWIPPGLPSQPKGTTPWIPHQVLLHNRREQHPGYHQVFLHNRREQHPGYHTRQVVTSS